MIPTRVLYYGKDEPLPERMSLVAGPLTLIYEDGDLRTVKWGGYEVLRRIYVAIRDRNWGTVAGVLTNFVAEIHADHFALTFDVANREGEVDFAWRGTITGSAAGVLTYEMDGIARRTFLRNRIGFCILHPAECAGAQCCIEHVVNEYMAVAEEAAALPLLIQPHQPLKPFAELAGLAHEVAPGVWANLRFDGDIFEMEDQRNWTDASFKTFCTPLRLPYPVEIAEGARITQRVTLQVSDERRQVETVASASAPARLVFTVDANLPALPLPELGLVAAAQERPLPPVAVQRLAALNLRHLRVDLRLGSGGLAEELRAGAAEAAALGVPVHLALYIDAAKADEQLAQLLVLLKEVSPQVTRWLVFPAPEKFLGGTPQAEVLAAAHRALDGWAPDAEFAAGTDTDFIFVQRSLPPLDQIDLLTFSINPQVHAFDNASLVETLATQATAVQSARTLAQGKPAMVSPITFKMRYNAYASAPPLPTPSGQLPANVDVRQMSLFGAGWTLGSIAAMAAGGAASATYFETTGWRGVMENAGGPLLPAKFTSLPGGLFPLYHVLAAVGACAGGQVLHTISSDPLRLVGLALQKNGLRRVLLANVTPQTQQVDVGGLAGPVRVRVLDETNAEAAMLDAEIFGPTGGRIQAPAACLTLELLPYAVACVDSA